VLPGFIGLENKFFWANERFDTGLFLTVGEAFFYSKCSKALHDLVRFIFAYFLLYLYVEDTVSNRTHRFLLACSIFTLDSVPNRTEYARCSPFTQLGVRKLLGHPPDDNPETLSVSRFSRSTVFANATAALRSKIANSAVRTKYYRAAGRISRRKHTKRYGADNFRAIKIVCSAGVVGNYR